MVGGWEGYEIFIRLWEKRFSEFPYLKKIPLVLVPGLHQFLPLF
jgi:hypothetical protein